MIHGNGKGQANPMTTQESNSKSAARKVRDKQKMRDDEVKRGKWTRG